MRLIARRRRRARRRHAVSRSRLGYTERHLQPAAASPSSGAGLLALARSAARTYRTHPRRDHRPAGSPMSRSRPASPAIRQFNDTMQRGLRDDTDTDAALGDDRTTPQARRPPEPAALPVRAAVRRRRRCCASSPTTRSQVWRSIARRTYAPHACHSTHGHACRSR
ncbi:MAG: hypothetical protein WKF83_12845 [Nocardioidaceae bacterium]